MAAQGPSRNPYYNDRERSLRSVFVGNIPFEATETELREIFEQAGPIANFRIVTDRESGKPKGFGFIEYQDAATAASCVRNLNNVEYNGRPLRVGAAASGDHPSGADIKALQQAMGPAVQESPYGATVETGQAPEAISKAVSSLPPEQMFELMKQMKLCIQNNPNEARNMLLQNPQLAYALLQAQIVMKIVDPAVAMALLHRERETVPPVKNDPPPVQAEAPRPTLLSPAGARPPLSGLLGDGPPAGQLDPRLQGPPVQHPTAMPPTSQPQPGLFMNEGASRDRPPMGAERSPMDRERWEDRRRSAERPGPGPPRGPRDFEERPRGGPGDRGGWRDDRHDDRDYREQRDRRSGGPPPHQQGGYMDRGGPRGMPGPRGGPAEMGPRGGPTDLAGTSGGLSRPQHVPQQPGFNRPPADGPAAGPGASAAAGADSEKAALIMQVLQLTDEQIQQLPTEQRASILLLKQQLQKR